MIDNENRKKMKQRIVKVLVPQSGLIPAYQKNS